MDGLDGLDELLDTLSEEELAQLLNLGTMDERQGLMQQEYGQVESLRPEAQQHSTALGAILGGLGNAGGNLMASMHQKKLMGGMEGITDERQGGRDLYAKVILDAARRAKDKARQDMANSLAPQNLIPNGLR